MPDWVHILTALSAYVLGSCWNSTCFEVANVPSAKNIPLWRHVLEFDKTEFVNKPWPGSHVMQEGYALLITVIKFSTLDLERNKAAFGLTRNVHLAKDFMKASIQTFWYKWQWFHMHHDNNTYVNYVICMMISWCTQYICLFLSSSVPIYLSIALFLLLPLLIESKEKYEQESHNGCLGGAVG